MLNCVKGGTFVLQTVVKVHRTNPRKNIPRTLTNVVITLKINAKTIFEAGKNVLTMLNNEVAAAGELLCWIVGTKNPSRACPE